MLEMRKEKRPSKQWVFRNPLFNVGEVSPLLAVAAKWRMDSQWPRLHAALWASGMATARNRAPAVRQASIVCFYAADAVAFAEEATDRLQDQRDVAIECVKILLAVIEGDAEFRSAERVAKCVELVKRIMEDNDLMQIESGDARGIAR